MRNIRSFAVAVGMLLGAACGQPESPRPDLTYDREYPQIGYADRNPAVPAARLVDDINSGDIRLAPDASRGYLDAVLAELEIDVSSQVLVYSRTSVLTRFIRAATPRAIYFNDDTYVAWTPDAPTIEVSAFAPELGPVFYTVRQGDDAEPPAEREFGSCLRCHDTYGMSGGGVPRLLLGSGYTGADGELVSHEAWILTGQATPLRSRWGGWYVTGQHGTQVHLGNIVVERATDLQDIESLRVGNIDTLDGLLDTSRYPGPFSDIVALLVLEHQVEVQNLISRLAFEASTGVPIATFADALADAMLMLDAIAFTDEVSGTSGFTAYFEAQGPTDSAGRSLRQFDLQTRLFRYPVSYLIYSEGFQALPSQAKSAVYARIRDALLTESADDNSGEFSAANRQAASDILRATLPEVFSE